MDEELKKLASRVAELRGETLASLIRRAIRRELVLLGYLDEEVRKAVAT